MAFEQWQVVVVPFPFAAGDHQRRNAQALVDAGAAFLVLDRELTPERLAETLRPLLVDAKLREATRERARALGHPDATERVVAECLAVVRGEAVRSDA